MLLTGWVFEMVLLAQSAKKSHTVLIRGVTSNYGCLKITAAANSQRHE